MPHILQGFSPETKKRGGEIESALVEIAAMQQRLTKEVTREIPGTLLLKCDSHLAISGSIKARGGIYEVLKHAEDLVLEHKLINTGDDYALLDSDRFRRFFSNFGIAVGSTGNLGLSIGIMGARLGFRVSVHMSIDAKKWKKELLRQKGVTVIEHRSDYSRAVEQGRAQAATAPNMYFIDDESSTDLFLGYAVAASRLKKQLDELSIPVGRGTSSLCLFALRRRRRSGGDNIRPEACFSKIMFIVFFAEPTSSPCMLLGLMTGLHNRVSVHDFGLNNRDRCRRPWLWDGPQVLWGKHWNK